jgi:hypothetical protein
LKPAFQRPAFWSLAGLFLLAFAGWEAMQITRGGRTGFADAHLPPPLQSRSGERPLLVRETQTGDSIANYLIRAKRGMTEQEVRWMIEDFEAAGLDRYEEALSDFEVAKVLRKKHEEWYLTALGEGLSLTREQKEGAQAKLAALFSRDLQIIAGLGQQSSNASEVIGDETLPKENVFKFKLRFGCFLLGSGSACAPWNLADLTEAQTSLTLKFWRIEEWKREKESNPLLDSGDDAESDDWLYTAKGREGGDPFSDSPQSTLRAMPGVPAMQDPLSGNLTEFPNTELWIATSEDGQRVDAYLPCGNILPLTPDQMPLWERSYDLAAQALLCHPAQLRLALLQQPGLAQTLREQLDRAPSQRGIENSPKASSTSSE